MASKHMFKITYDEAAIITMSLALAMENLTKSVNRLDAPWTPDARRALNEMIANGRSAARKLEQLTGIKPTLPPMDPNDEKFFFTKPS